VISQQQPKLRASSPRLSSESARWPLPIPLQRSVTGWRPKKSLPRRYTLVRAGQSERQDPKVWTPELVSSHEVHRRPLRRVKCCASSPGDPKTSFAADVPSPRLFRPCRFSRLRRFTPHRTLQVCCTLHPAMGFAWFRGNGPESPSSLLASAVPFEAFPSLAARLRSRAQGLSARAFHPKSMPSRCWSRVPRVATLHLVPSASGLCSATESVANHVTLRSRVARCSLGLMADTLSSTRAVARARVHK